MTEPVQQQVEVIGDYEIFKNRILGKGSWGNVFRGRQISLDREVAVKILKEEFSRDEEFVRRFIREAKCIAKLTDENIIQVYGAGKHEGCYYFAMEFVHGMTLQKFVEYGRKFTPDEIIYIGYCVAKALRAAWTSPARIIHRDIKPSNIMISFSSSIVSVYRQMNDDDSAAFINANIKDSRIKVMDFGLAKAALSSDQDATLVGTIIGTPKYISPEQGLGNPADIRSDIYSLGIVLYELATNTIPFVSDNAISLVRHHIYDNAVPVRQVNPKIPVELENVIMKCIRKDPSDRFANPMKLIAALEEIRPSPGRAYTPREMPTIIAPRPEPKRLSSYDKTQLDQIIQKATDLHNRHLYYEAIQKAQECYKIVPEYSEAKRVIEKAKDMVYRVLELNKNAKTLVNKGRYEQSLAVYQLVLGLDPNSHDAREGIKVSNKGIKQKKHRWIRFALGTALVLLVCGILAAGYYAGAKWQSNKTHLETAQDYIKAKDYVKAAGELKELGDIEKMLINSEDYSQWENCRKFVRTMVDSDAALKKSEWKEAYDDYLSAKDFLIQSIDVTKRISDLQAKVVNIADADLKDKKWKEAYDLYNVEEKIGITSTAKAKEDLRQALRDYAEQEFTDDHWEKTYSLYTQDLRDCDAASDEVNSCLGKMEDEIIISANNCIPKEEEKRTEGAYNAALNHLYRASGINSNFDRIKKRINEITLEFGDYKEKKGEKKSDDKYKNEDERREIQARENKFKDSLTAAQNAYKDANQKGEGYNRALEIVNEALLCYPNNAKACELKTNILMAERGMVFVITNTFHCMEYTHRKTGLNFVQLPSGTLPLGLNSVSKTPTQMVAITGFFISGCEVTQDAWQKIMGNNPSDYKGNLRESHPVENVSWNDCISFCRQAGLRLPTCQQWEYAYRAGTITKFYWGDSPNGEYMWHRSNSGYQSQHVGKTLPNLFGLFDMSGNVGEWCYDSCGSHSAERALRGGSCTDDEYQCDSTFIDSRAPDYHSKYTGLRVIWENTQLPPSVSPPNAH